MTVPTGLVSAAGCFGRTGGIIGGLIGCIEGSGGVTDSLGGVLGGITCRGCSTTGTVGFTKVGVSSWLACSNALANACIFAKRSFGSLASVVITTCSTSGEIVGTFSRKGEGGVTVCWTAISVKEP